MHVSIQPPEGRDLLVDNRTFQSTRPRRGAIQFQCPLYPTKPDFTAMLVNQVSIHAPPEGRD